MTMDETTSIVVTLVGMALGFAGVVFASGIVSFDRRGKRLATICATLMLIGTTAMWCASSAGFAS